MLHRQGQLQFCCGRLAVGDEFVSTEHTPALCMPTAISTHSYLLSDLPAKSARISDTFLLLHLQPVTQNDHHLQKHTALHLGMPAPCFLLHLYDISTGRSMR